MVARPSADDLLVLLEVSRTGRFTRAAGTLGINHVTVARRIATLEKAFGGKVLVRTAGGWEATPLGRRALDAAERLNDVLLELTADPREPAIEDVVRLSATDVFSTHVAAPAAARVHRRHPGIRVEIVTVTRRAAQHRSGLDMEIVIGRPTVLRAEAIRLGSYVLGLYGEAGYLAENPPPRSTEDLRQHRLIYFISSMLQVDDLDVDRGRLGDMPDGVTATNPFAHVEATRAGGGLGLLPTFLARRHPELLRVLPVEIAIPMEYWLVARSDALRRPAVAAVLTELQATMSAMEDDLAAS